MLPPLRYATILSFAATLIDVIAAMRLIRRLLLFFRLCCRSQHFATPYAVAAYTDADVIFRRYAAADGRRLRCRYATTRLFACRCHAYTVSCRRHFQRCLLRQITLDTLLIFTYAATLFSAATITITLPCRRADSAIDDDVSCFS